MPLPSSILSSSILAAAACERSIARRLTRLPVSARVLAEGVQCGYYAPARGCRPSATSSANGPSLPAGDRPQEGLLSSPVPLEMEGNFIIACKDQDVTEVVLLSLLPGGVDEVGWPWASQFDIGDVGSLGQARHRHGLQRQTIAPLAVSLYGITREDSLSPLKTKPPLEMEAILNSSDLSTLSSDAMIDAVENDEVIAHALKEELARVAMAEASGAAAAAATSSQAGYDSVIEFVCRMMSSLSDGKTTIQQSR